MKISLNRTLKASLACALSAALLASTVPAMAAPAVIGGIKVDPYTQYQTLEGWGSSLCWWGNIIGAWDADKDTNKNGRSDREEIAELAFSPDYLNLNVVRYNVGGGEDPTHFDKTGTAEGQAEGDHMARVEGRVPGWTSDMYYDANGNGVVNAADGTYDEEKFMSKTTDEMSDAGQIWILEQANKYRQKAAQEGKTGTEGSDILNVAFSNSPPYYMTYSGCATGAKWGVEGAPNGDENLKYDQYNAFADYMTNAVKWLNQDLGEKYGTQIDVVTPLNEPDQGRYWHGGSNKQEGCLFYQGTSQSNMFTAMRTSLDNAGLTETKMDGPEETGIDGSYDAFNKLTPEARNSLDVIAAHTYSGGDKARLRDTAASYDKNIWMSEITRGGGSHTTENMNSVTGCKANDYSSGIINDLKNLQPSAWIAWLVSDSEYECANTNSNWGPIHTAFEENGPTPYFHTNLVNNDGTLKKEVAEPGSWHITKQFYTLMQYSKYLKAGYTMIEVGDGNMVGAVSPDGKELVIVADNSNGGERAVNLDLSKFATEGSDLSLIRTSGVETGAVQNDTTGDTTECATEVEGGATLTNGTLSSTLPNNSISTFVVKAGEGKTLYDVNSSIKTVNDQVYSKKWDNTTVSTNDVNKFQYSYDSWKGQADSAAYSSNLMVDTDVTTSDVTFTFDGTRAVIVGQKRADGAEYSVEVDGKPVEGTFSAKAASTLNNQALYDTGTLSEGTHTVKLIKTNQLGSTLAIDCAKIINGNVDLVDTPSISSIRSYDQALLVDFSTSLGVDSYNVKYGESADNLDQKIENVSSPAAITNLENGKTYYVQIEAIDKDGNVKTSEIASAAPADVSGEALYYVDAGKNDVDSLADGQQFGQLNCRLDQAYSTDLLSGKSWGYVSNTSGGTGYGDGDQWASVRYSSAKTAGNELQYKFDLDEGDYFVTVGTYDPWGNGSGRKQVITAQGQAMSDVFAPLQKQNTTTFKATVGAADDNTLTIGAKVADGGSDNSVISFIKIEKYDANAISSIENATASTIEGTTPTNLPATVKATTVSGETKDVAVTWNTDGVQFTADPFKTVNVTGTVEGTNKTATAAVQIIPANLEYFIDCNNTGSATYTNANTLTEGGLVNEVADQVKAENTWGNTSTDYGSYGGSVADPYSGGLYAKNGTALSYDVTLPAGTHTVSMGFTGWWNMNRAMSVYYSYDGQAETKLCDVTAPSNNTISAEGQITLNAEKTVTLTVKKAANDDPILSWLSVAKVPAAAPDSVSVKTQPTKTTYNPGDTLDLTGLVLEATYSDGTTEEITEGYTVSNVDMSTVGTKTVTVTCKGKSIDLTIQVKAVNKTVLNDFIVKAQSFVDDGTVDGMVESAKKVYLATLDKAKEVAANENATYAEVMDVQTKLMVCITSVSLQAGDKEALGSLLESCKYFTDEILAANYVEAGQAEYKAALADANKVYADGDAFQENVDKAHSDLSTAVLALRMKADKSALQALLNQVGGIDLSLYSEESAAVFTAALANVNSILANEALSVDDQATVDEAVKTLQAAVDGLELKQPAETPETPADPTDPGSSSEPSASIDSGSSSTSSKAGTTSKPSAKTGDASPMAGAAALALAAGAAAVLIKRRKK